MKSLFCLIFCLFLFIKPSLSIVTDENCIEEPEIDFMFAIDNTSSMSRFLNQLRPTLLTLLQTLSASYPGIRYGFVSFNDREVQCNLTRTHNYCARLDVPLSLNANPVIIAVNNLNSSFGGGQVPEDALGALLVGAANRRSNWRPHNPNINRLRFILVATDDIHRTPSARHDCPGPNMRTNDGDGDYDCVNESYPSVAQVQAQLNKFSITPIFFATRNTQRLKDNYSRLLQDLNQGGVLVSGDLQAAEIMKLITNLVQQFVCKKLPTAPPPTTTTTTTTTIEPFVQPEFISPDISTSPPTKSEDESSTAVVIGAAAAGATLGLASIGGVALYLKGATPSVPTQLRGDFANNEGRPDNIGEKEQVIDLDDTGFA